jgi:cytidylate kinase
MVMAYSVAIDGPAGAGKSTIAKLISKEMGYIYVDTGAMYRAMAVYFSKNKVNPEDESAINEAVKNVDIKIEYQNGEQQVILNGENVTGLLRTEETGNMASKTSKYKEVRSKLVELQRELAKTTDVVMDGRDIGTTVLPDAFVKIYLTASSDARAKRRYDELVAKGEQCDLSAIKEDIEKRDYQDMHREISPLKQAEDAVLLDTSDMNIEQVVAAMRDIIDNAVKNK